MQTQRRGLTQLDVVVMIGIALFLIAVLFPAGHRQHEGVSRVKCASNLKQIGQALLLYVNEHKAWPRTRYEPTTADFPTAFTGGDTTALAANDVTAAYRLLIPNADLVGEVFLCPTSPIADPAFVRESNRERANFADGRELSYSFVNPYPTEAARSAGYDLDKPQSAEFAVAADVNPGTDDADYDVTAVLTTSSARETRRGNSPNHDRDGQNVLFGDGHVEFVNTPFVGVGRDNVYTFGRRESRDAGFGVVGSPVGPADSILLPTFDHATLKENRLRDARSGAFAVNAIVACAGLLVAGVAWLLFGRRDGTPPAPPLPSA